jgi:hypothetical protein
LWSRDVRSPFVAWSRTHGIPQPYAVESGTEEKILVGRGDGLVGRRFHVNYSGEDTTFAMLRDLCGIGEGADERGCVEIRNWTQSCRSIEEALLVVILWNIPG